MGDSHGERDEEEEIALLVGARRQRCVCDSDAVSWLVVGCCWCWVTGDTQR